MKRANHLFPRIIDPDNLRWAVWNAQKGKRYSNQVVQFKSDLDKNLIQLRNQMIAGAVEVGSYHYFKVYDPKERQICAPPFQEQVLHHAMMNICGYYFERFQINHSYACRKGKGTHAAIKAAKKFTRNYGWYLKLDVRKFFDSIHHEVLKHQLSRLFKEHSVLNIFGQIIDSYAASPERGVPIGNLTSQYFANHYLAALDHFVKEILGCKAYVRYMDDMVFMESRKKPIKRILQSIR